MNLSKRKPTRLANFDYSTNGTYFITICTKNKKHIFGTVRARTDFTARIKKQSPQLSVEGFVLLYIQNCGCQAEINQQ